MSRKNVPRVSFYESVDFFFHADDARTRQRSYGQGRAQKKKKSFQVRISVNDNEQSKMGDENDTRNCSDVTAADKRRKWVTALAYGTPLIGTPVDLSSTERLRTFGAPQSIRRKR